MTSLSESWGPMKVGPLTETDARNICAWRYPAPYDVYDYADWETVVRCGWDLGIPEKRSAEYITLRTQNGLVAFGRLTCAQQYVLLGIGLRPDFCGLGVGPVVMETLIQLAKNRYPNLTLALEVRTFNSRAIRCYEKCGFRRVKQYVRNTLSGEDSFYFMVYGPRGK